jgi:hypothetical protein
MSSSLLSRDDAQGSDAPAAAAARDVDDASGAPSSSGRDAVDAEASPNASVGLYKSGAVQVENPVDP